MFMCAVKTQNLRIQMFTFQTNHKFKQIQLIHKFVFTENWMLMVSVWAYRKLSWYSVSHKSCTDIIKIWLFWRVGTGWLCAPILILFLCANIEIRVTLIAFFLFLLLLWLWLLRYVISLLCYSCFMRSIMPVRPTDAIPKLRSCMYFCGLPQNNRKYLLTIPIMLSDLFRCFLLIFSWWSFVNSLWFKYNHKFKTKSLLSIQIRFLAHPGHGQIMRKVFSEHI